MHKYKNENTQIFWARMLMKPILSSDCSLGRLSQQVGKTLHDNGGHKGKANTHTQIYNTSIHKYKTPEHTNIKYI